MLGEHGPEDLELRGDVQGPPHVLGVLGVHLRDPLHEQNRDHCRDDDFARKGLIST